MDAAWQQWRSALFPSSVLAELRVPSHRTAIKFSGNKLASVSLDASEKHGANRDFILRYRLAGAAVQAGVSLYEKGNEKFFMAMIEPPARVQPDAIVPREYVFVVDVSGSMHGFPLDTAKALLHSLVGELRPSDQFNLLFFSGGSALMAPRSLPALRPTRPPVAANRLLPGDR